MFTCSSCTLFWNLSLLSSKTASFNNIISHQIIKCIHCACNTFDDHYYERHVAYRIPPCTYIGMYSLCYCITHLLQPPGQQIQSEQFLTMQHELIRGQKHLATLQSENAGLKSLSTYSEQRAKKLESQVRAVVPTLLSSDLSGLHTCTLFELTNSLLQIVSALIIVISVSGYII